MMAEPPRAGLSDQGKADMVAALSAALDVAEESAQMSARWREAFARKAIDRLAESHGAVSAAPPGELSANLNELLEVVRLWAETQRQAKAITASLDPASMAPEDIVEFYALMDFSAALNFHIMQMASAAVRGPGVGPDGGASRSSRKGRLATDPRNRMLAALGALADTETSRAEAANRWTKLLCAQRRRLLDGHLLAADSSKSVWLATEDVVSALSEQVAAAASATHQMREVLAAAERTVARGDLISSQQAHEWAQAEVVSESAAASAERIAAGALRPDDLQPTAISE